MSGLLELDDLHKSFGTVEVLCGVTLGVDEAETLVLLGPSGSGKTTLLRAIAGFETVDRGGLRLDGDDITRRPPERRNFGMVFQHYALFPHLSVAENVAFGLESRKGAVRPGREAIADRVRESLALVDLEGLAGRRIHELSGGQQQRVALARALAPEPRVLLLDEPLSNLDPTLREETRQELRRTLKSLGITAIWVTHEQQEAFDVGDRVAVLNRGLLEQVGSPDALYRRPESAFVARFVGLASRLAGRVVGSERVEIGAAAVVWRADGDGLAAGAEVEVVVRPEDLELQPAGVGAGLAGRVTAKRFAGAHTFFTVAVEVGGEAVVAAAIDAAAIDDSVTVAQRPEAPPASLFASAGEGR